MKFREGHRGFEDLTEEEAKMLAEEFYAADCAEMAESEVPPEYVDEFSSPIAARILEDLENELPVRKRASKRRTK